MKFRHAGVSGLPLSELGFGTWLSSASARMPQPEVFPATVRRAWERGIRFFDTADVYVKGAAEKELGLNLADYHQSDYVFATKCFFPISEEGVNRGLSRKHITESVRASLERSGRSSIDILFCHRFDPVTSVREIVLSMRDIIAEGFCHHWGTSEWPVDTLEEALLWANRIGAPYPVADQYELNLLNLRTRRERSGKLNKLGIGAIAWSPLAGGLLTGKYRGHFPSDSRFGTFVSLKEKLRMSDLARSTKFGNYCFDLNVEPVHVALQVLLRDPHLTSVIIGATCPEHVDIACNAFDAKIDSVIIDRACLIVDDEDVGAELSGRVHGD